VTAIARRTPVFSVPKQLLVAAVWDEVVNHVSDRFAWWCLLGAVHTEPIFLSLQPHLTLDSPLVPIATLRRRLTVRITLTLDRLSHRFNFGFAVWARSGDRLLTKIANPCATHAGTWNLWGVIINFKIEVERGMPMIVVQFPATKSPIGQINPLVAEST